MNQADQMQVQVFEDYLKKQERICRCGLSLAEHAVGEEGYARPALRGNCLNFTDEISKAAAKQLMKPKERAPLGWVR